jgi:group I intron endonuclease
MVIYLTTNMINGKRYLGKDSKNDPNYLGSGTILKRAIEKYGKKHFKKEIIEECYTLTHLSEREEYWLNYYDAGNNSNFYNMHNHSVGTPSGIKNKLFGTSLSKEHRTKISKGLMGRVQSEETRKKIKESNIGKNKGKLASSETRKKLSIAATGRCHTEESKNKIRIKSVGNKSRTGMSHSQETKNRISITQIGVKKNPESVYKNFLSQKKKPIVQYDINGNFLMEYDGVRLASRMTGIKRQALISALKDKTKTSGGFIWKYKNNRERN